MSVEIVLIPLAIAAVKALAAAYDARETQQAERRVVTVGTRMKDPRLLMAALADMSASVHTEGDTIVARWASASARFTRAADGIWTAHFAGEVTAETGASMVQAIDRVYGTQVQSEVVKRILANAESNGLTVLDHRVAEDRTVTMTLGVNR